MKKKKRDETLLKNIQVHMRASKKSKFTEKTIHSYFFEKNNNNNKYSEKKKKKKILSYIVENMMTNVKR